MQPDIFADELTKLIEDAHAKRMPHEDIAAAVAKFFHDHGRTPPPPIEGTLTLDEPPDAFG